MYTSIFCSKKSGGSLFSSLGFFIFEVLVFETPDILQAKYLTFEGAKSAGEHSC